MVLVSKSCRLAVGPTLLFDTFKERCVTAGGKMAGT